MTKAYDKTSQTVIKPHVTDFHKNWDVYASPYAYAANEPKLAFRMPGDLSGPSLWSNKYAGSFHAAEILVEGLLRDGWLEAQKADLDDPAKHIVSLAAHSAFPIFALYRRDADGTHSYKAMKAEPTNVTKEGRLILDPEEITRGTSERFLGNFVMPAQGMCFKPQ